jgi:hypothetical protein
MSAMEDGRRYLDLGWGREPMTVQLDGIVGRQDADHFEKDADALMRLRIRGYITDSQLSSISGKIIKRVERTAKRATPTGAGRADG